MKIILVPETDTAPKASARSNRDPAPLEPDRPAGRAHVVEVELPAPTATDRLSDSEWSALMGLS